MIGGSNSNENSNDGQNSSGRSSGGSRNLLGEEVQDQLKQRQEEQLLFARFKNAASNSLDKLSRQIEQNGGEKLKMGDEEKKIISNLSGMGLKEGMAAGIVTFIVLRKGPVHIGRWVRRRQLAQYQQYPSSPSSSPQTPPFSSTNSNGGYKLSDPRMATNNPFQRAANKQEFPRSGSLVVRSIWFVFDATLALMMGASTSMAYTDTDLIREQIVDMPLVPGRSLTSDALCDPVVEELTKVKAEKNPAYIRLQKLNQDGAQTPASYYLDGIVKFCENCERRRYMETRIRQEKGLEKAYPVEIPRPGVSRNGPRLVVDIVGEEKVVNSDGTEEPFTDQFGHDLSWASDYVKDNNDQDNNM
jgi:hypothetical protein